MRYCRQTAEAAAEALGIPADSVLVASTGVIGMQLPMDRIAEAAVEHTIAVTDLDRIPLFLSAPEIHIRKAGASAERIFPDRCYR